MSSGSTSTRAGLPIRGGRARPANGRARPPGFRASPRGGSATGTPLRARSSRSPQLAQQRELRAGGYYWAARSEQAAGRPASVEAAAQAAAATPTNRPRASTDFSRARRSACRPRLGRGPVHRLRSTGRPICPTSSAPSSSPGSANRHLPRKCFVTRRRSGGRRASCADPARQEARPSGRAAVARRSTASGERAPMPTTAIPTRAGVRSTAGASIPPSPSATSSRNRHSAAPRSAPQARSA